jgi:hypothetical protein
MTRKQERIEIADRLIETAKHANKDERTQLLIHLCKGLDLTPFWILYKCKIGELGKIQ